jgi:hypothetical protein
VNRAITAACDYGIAAGSYSTASIVGSFLARAADGEFSVDSSSLKDADGVVQLRVAAAAPGIGIEEDSCFAHSLVGPTRWPDHEFSVSIDRQDFPHMNASIWMQ